MLERNYIVLKNVSVRKEYQGPTARRQSQAKNSQLGNFLLIFVPLNTNFYSPIFVLRKRKYKQLNKDVSKQFSILFPGLP